MTAMTAKTAKTTVGKESQAKVENARRMASKFSANPAVESLQNRNLDEGGKGMGIIAKETENRMGDGGWGMGKRERVRAPMESEWHFSPNFILFTMD